MLRDAFEHLLEIERKRIETPANTVMRLGRLERPEPWPRELVEEMRRTAPFGQVQQYPDYLPFYARLGEFLDVDPESIVVGAGIEEFIRTLMASASGGKVAMLWPTCAMFGIYAKAFQCELVKIVPDPRQPLTVHRLIAQLPDDVRLLILANPGQPVETHFEPADLWRIANECKARGALLAIDEAYFGFGAHTFIRDAAVCRNAVVLRTFSKAFGAAGMRLGYAVGGRDIVRAIDAVRQSGEVSALSMHVARILMDRHEEFVAPAIERVKQGRNWLRDQVETQLGLRTWGDVANHVLIDLGSPRRRAEVCSRLALRGVYVKGDFPEPLESYMLVTCGSPGLMQRFYDELCAV